MSSISTITWICPTSTCCDWRAKFIAIMVIWRSLQRSRSFYVDEDHLTYFIHPADLSLAAGIRSDHSLSPCSTKTSNTLSGGPLAKLKRWILRIERYYFRSKLPGRHHPVLLESTQPPEIGSPGLRGRSDIRTSSANRETLKLRPTPRRQRAWREPSGNLWPVAEEQEDEIN